MTSKQKTFLVCFILFGIYWFIPVLSSVELGESVFFMGTYLYLPGIALPLIVFLTLKRIGVVQLILYVALSWGIYYVSIQIFSEEFVGSYYVAAFLGALAFLLVTSYFLYKKIDIKFPLIGAVAAAVVFVFMDVVDRVGFQIACFLWTAIVGVMIVMEDRKDQGKS